jgi:hypothetical protein
VNEVLDNGLLRTAPFAVCDAARFASHSPLVARIVKKSAETRARALLSQALGDVRVPGCRAL